jgi:hypothetical protein
VNLSLSAEQRDVMEKNIKLQEDLSGAYKQVRPWGLT